MTLHIKQGNSMRNNTKDAVIAIVVLILILLACSTNTGTSPSNPSSSSSRQNCLDKLSSGDGTCHFEMRVQHFPQHRNHFKWGAFRGYVQFELTRRDTDLHCLFVEDPNGPMTIGGYDGKPLIRGDCNDVTRSNWDLTANIGGDTYGVAGATRRDAHRSPRQHCDDIRRQTISKIQVLGGLENMCG